MRYDVVSRAPNREDAAESRDRRIATSEAFRALTLAAATKTGAVAPARPGQ